MAALKHLFIGYFNYAGEVHALRCHACSKDQAWLILCRRLADKKGVEAHVMYQRFDRQYGQYTIEKEIEYQEVDS